MYRYIFIAAVAAALVGPAQAQNARGGDTSKFLLGSSQAPSLQFNPDQPPAYSAATNNFSFLPDPDLRQGVTRGIMAGVKRRTPELAASLGEQPFASFGPALASHGISDNRLDDALTFMMLALWDAANASDAETTADQTAGVKRQAQAILATLPGGQPSGVSIQEASDSLYITALTFAILTSKVLETRDPATVAQLQRAASRETMASFGVDFRGLALTGQGIERR